MNRNGDKSASHLQARTVGGPAAVRDRPIHPDLADVARPDAPLVSALPFGEMEGVLYALARLVAQRDYHTAGHSERLAFSGVALGVAMRLDSASLLLLYIGGYLHDIGKVGIPDSILFKPGKLSGPEWEIMRAHPVLGEEICRPLQSPSGLLPLVRHHHADDGDPLPVQVRHRFVKHQDGRRVDERKRVPGALFHPRRIRPDRVVAAGEDRDPFEERIGPSGIERETPDPHCNRKVLHRGKFFEHLEVRGNEADESPLVTGWVVWTGGE